MRKDLYIYFSDRKNLQCKDGFCVLAGIVFFNAEEHNRFLDTKYIDREKKIYTFGAMINVNLISDIYQKDATSQKKYIDFIHRSVLKQLFSDFMNREIINNEDEVYVNLYIGHQSVVENPYYDLTNNVVEVLVNNLFLRDYNKVFSTYFFKRFTCSLKPCEQKNEIAANTAEGLAKEMEDIIQNSPNKIGCVRKEIRRTADIFLQYP